MSASTCELCGSAAALTPYQVPPAAGMSGSVQVCDVCGPQLAPGAELDANHWYCLQECIWSESAPVQVLSLRLAKRLAPTQGWAQELVDQAYLTDEVRAWAEAGDGDSATADDAPATLDSNGTALSDGDSVTLIKDLNVKGAGFTAKRGTLVKNIKLTDDPTHIEGRVNKVAIFLKTCFLKKV